VNTDIPRELEERGDKAFGSAAVLLAAMFTLHLPYGFSSIKLVAVTAASAGVGCGNRQSHSASR
jgi:hypothetical protein